MSSSQKSTQFITASVALAIYVGVVLQYILRDFTLQLRFLLFSSNWSYLIACYFSVLVATYSVLARAGVSVSIRISRVLLFVVLALLALITYFMGYVNEYYLLQYHGLSLVLMVFAAINLTFNLERATEVVVALLILLFTIPVPLVTLRAYLSFFVSITNSVSRQILLVNPGLALAGSTLSTAPLLLATLRSEGFTRRSIARSTLSLLVAIAVGLLGDIARISLCFRSGELGVLGKLFSSTLTYALVSVLSALLLNRRGLFSRLSIRGEDVEEKRARLTPTLLIAIALALLTTLTCVVQALSLISPSGRGLEIKVYNYEEFASKPASIILGELGFGVSNERTYKYSDGAEDILLSEYTLSSEVAEYTGILDLTKTPCKLYSIEALLEYEGYRVKQKWVNQNDNDVTIYYIAEDSSNGVLVAEKLAKLIVAENNSREEYYARVTLMARIRDNVGDLVNAFNNTLTSISGRKLDSQAFNVLKALVTSLYVFIFSLLIYLSIEPLRQVLKHLWKTSR